jgi:RsiW-degrading membrane proteinase PrsW (M82 family)
LLLYLTFALCGLGAAALVYRYDLYDREPIPAAALAVGLGAITMALADPLERLIFAYLRTESAAALAAVAALVEEGFKLLVVVVFAVFARRVFNDPMDGLIYGSLAGLGAALEEGVAVLRGGANRSPAAAGRAGAPDGPSRDGRRGRLRGGALAHPADRKPRGGGRREPAPPTPRS